jgi:hypothetical protein
MALNVTIESLMAATRRTYSGPLEIGRDLTIIEVGQAVTVDHIARRPTRTRTK